MTKAMNDHAGDNDEGGAMMRVTAMMIIMVVVMTMTMRMTVTNGQDERSIEKKMQKMMQ